MTKEKDKKPNIDFEKISKELADLEHKQHIDQIGPSMTDVYLKHARYTDSKGVVRFKKKFTREEAEKLADDSYDALGYHSHRRVFGLDEDQYNALKQFKDANGKPYMDAVTEYHFKISRRRWKKTLARDDKDNVITHKNLEERLEEPIKEHAGLLQAGIIERHNLDDPEHMDAVKDAVMKIVDKYKIGKRVVNPSKLKSPQEILGAYIQLSQTHYSEGVHS